MLISNIRFLSFHLKVKVADILYLTLPVFMGPVRRTDKDSKGEPTDQLSDPSEITQTNQRPRTLDIDTQNPRSGALDTQPRLAQQRTYKIK